MLQRPPTFRINRQAPLANGLVFAGLGGGASTLMMADASGYANHGTLSNMTPASDWIWVPELGRWGLDFDGSNDRVLLPSNFQLTTSNPQPDAALACWFQTGNLSQTNKAIFGWLDTEYQFEKYGRGFAIVNSELTCYSESNNSNDAIRATIDSSWHHLAANFSASGAFYLDGALVDSGELDDGWSYFLCIGSGTTDNSNNRLPVEGSIVDTLYFNRALSPSEIQQLADPSNVMLSGLIQPPQRRWWPVVSAPASSIIPRIMHHRKMMGAA